MVAYSADVSAALGRLQQFNGGFYDQSSNIYGFAGIGYKTNFPQSLNDVALVANAIKAQADSALSSATAAASVSASRIKATSTTNLAIAASGTRTFATAENLVTAQPIFPGDVVKAVSTASPTNYMVGKVSAVSANSVTIALTKSSGSGTFAAWQLQTQGEDGAATGISSVSQDTAPSLGGNLTTGTYLISFSTGGGASFASDSLGIAMNGAPLRDAALGLWREAAKSLGAASNAIGLSLADSVHKVVVLSGNATVTLPSTVPDGYVSALTLEVKQPAGQSYTLDHTDPSVVVISGAGLSAPASGTSSMFVFTRRGAVGTSGQPDYIAAGKWICQRRWGNLAV